MNSTNKDDSLDQNIEPKPDVEDKLKGDVIGGTMYTQRFVLKTLLKLKDLEWNEELEEDLCFLWDSTVEREVCEYLMEVNFPSIACNVMLEYNTIEYGRLIEILVGIIANITTAKCTQQLESEQIDIILNLLVCTDSLVLIQVMRFIIAVSFNFETLKTFLTDEKGEDILKLFKFILKSSSNFELIQKTLEALSKMTADSKTNLFFDAETMKISLKACVRSVTQDEETEFELFTSEQRNNVKYLIEYVLNFCVYINQVDTEVVNIENCLNIYINFFIKLCEWYSSPENLLPITDEILFYFEASNYIFLTLKVGYSSDLFKNIFLILKILIDNKCEDLSEFIEMCCYFIHKGESNCLKIDLKTILPPCDIEKICSVLSKHDSNSNFDLKKEKLTEIY